MVDKIIKAAQNPDLANALIEEALKEPTQNETEIIEVRVPSEGLVALPGGYMNPAGEVVRIAEVRELTGRDEEAIAKVTTVGRMLNTVLSRAVVKIGEIPATDALLDELLSGDREELLLGIIEATFGSAVDVPVWCMSCEDTKSATVDLKNDIKRKILMDPVGDRQFLVTGKKAEYSVLLPTGHVQRELNASGDRTAAEAATLILEDCVHAIDGKPVYDKSQIKNLSMMDRRTLLEEISKRNPGPVLQDIPSECPDCDAEVVVPINFGAFFRF